MKNLQTKVVALTPLWLVLLSPFFLFPSGFKVIALPGLPLLWWLNKREKGYFIRRTPFDWAILVMFLMVLISEYATFDLSFSLVALAGFLFSSSVFYAVVETVKTRQGIEHSLVLYLLLGMFVVILGILDTQWLDKILILSTVTQHFPTLLEKLPGGTIHPNTLAGTLLWFFPLQASLLWYFLKQKGTSILCWKLLLLGISFVLTMMVFIFTQSRGGWAGGIIALTILGGYLHRYLRWGIGVGGSMAVIAASIIGWQRIGELLVSDTTEAVVGNLGSLGFRQEVWRAAIWGLRDFPFTGMGMGTFREVSRVLYPMNVSPTYDIGHAHNQLLQMGLDLGVPGLIAFISLWFLAGYLLVQTIRHTKDAFVKSVAVGVTASLGGYFIYALSDTIALGTKPGFFLWWLFALAAGVYRYGSYHQVDLGE